MDPVLKRILRVPDQSTTRRYLKRPSGPLSDVVRRPMLKRIHLQPRRDSRGTKRHFINMMSLTYPVFLPLLKFLQHLVVVAVDFAIQFPQWPTAKVLLANQRRDCTRRTRRSRYLWTRNQCNPSTYLYKSLTESFNQTYSDNTNRFGLDCQVSWLFQWYDEIQRIHVVKFREASDVGDVCVTHITSRNIHHAGLIWQIQRSPQYFRGQ